MHAAFSDSLRQQRQRLVHPQADREGLTGPRIEVRDGKSMFDEFNGGYKTFPLDSILVKIIRVSTWAVISTRGEAEGGEYTTVTHFEVITMITPQSSSCSNKRRRIIASTMSVTC